MLKTKLCKTKPSHTNEISGICKVSNGITTIACSNYESIGYKTIQTSAITGDGLKNLKHILKDQISLLSGHSGVGKSAIINKIDPNLNLKTGQISDYHLKGMHTTTFATMFPLSFGGNVIDTPGIKEFGLVEFEKVALGQRFPEIRCLMKDCKFNNCVHLNEPGCAVIAAVENGEIAEYRYENYLNMLKSPFTARNPKDFKIDVRLVSKIEDLVEQLFG